MSTYTETSRQMVIKVNSCCTENDDGQRSQQNSYAFLGQQHQPQHQRFNYYQPQQRRLNQAQSKHNDNGDNNFNGISSTLNQIPADYHYQSNKLPVNFFHSATEYNKMLITYGKKRINKNVSPITDGLITSLQFVNDRIFKHQIQKREQAKKKLAAASTSATMIKSRRNHKSQACMCCCCEDQVCHDCIAAAAENDSERVFTNVAQTNPLLPDAHRFSLSSLSKSTSANPNRQYQTSKRRRPYSVNKHMQFAKNITTTLPQTIPTPIKHQRVYSSLQKQSHSNSKYSSGVDSSGLVPMFKKQHITKVNADEVLKKKPKPFSPGGIAKRVHSSMGMASGIGSNQNKMCAVSSKNKNENNSLDSVDVESAVEGLDATCSDLNGGGADIRHLLMKSLLRFQEQRKVERMLEISKSKGKKAKQQYLKNLNQEIRMINLEQSRKSVPKRMKSSSRSTKSPSKHKIASEYWQQVKPFIQKSIANDTHTKTILKHLADYKFNIYEHAQLPKKQRQLTDEMAQALKLKRQFEAKEKLKNQIEEKKMKKKSVQKNLKKLNKERLKRIKENQKKPFRPTADLIHQAFKNIVQPSTDQLVNEQNAAQFSKTKKERKRSKKK